MTVQYGVDYQTAISCFQLICQPLNTEGLDRVP